MFPIAQLLGIGSQIIDKLIPDPEAKAKAQIELQKMAQDGELTKLVAQSCCVVLPHAFNFLSPSRLKDLIEV